MAQGMEITFSDTTEMQYEVTTGNSRYLANAAKVAFGGDSSVFDREKV